MSFIINSTMRYLSRKADSLSAVPEIPDLSCNPKVNCRVHKSLSLDIIPRQLHPDCSLNPHFSKIRRCN
jgi:hypothetical protein